MANDFREMRAPLPLGGLPAFQHIGGGPFADDLPAAVAGQMAGTPWPVASPPAASSFLHRHVNGRKACNRVPVATGQHRVGVCHAG